MTTRAEARDEVAAIINTALADEDEITINWEWVQYEIPQPTETWVRVSMRHDQGTQRSLGDYQGKRRYLRTGFAYAEIFTPFGDGLTQDDRLSTLLVAALRSVITSSGLILRNATAREIGADGGWFKTNVIVEFEYEEIG